MDEQQTPNANTQDPVEVVAAAIARLGEATAAKIAEEARQGYSTVTARLRTLESAGRAEKTRGADRRTYWRLLPATPPTPTDAPADPPQDASTVDGHPAATSPEAAQAPADPDTDAGSTSARKHSNNEDAATTTPALPDEGAPATPGPATPPAPPTARPPWPATPPLRRPRPAARSRARPAPRNQPQLTRTATSTSRTHRPLQTVPGRKPQPRRARLPCGDRPDTSPKSPCRSCAPTRTRSTP